jgi:glucose/arabinose dehydrogenase
MLAKKTNLSRAMSYTRLRITSICTMLLLGSLLLLHGCKPDPGLPTKGVDIQLIADNFTSPIGVVAAPDISKRLFVIDQVGKIWIIDADGNKLATPFLDISGKLVTLNPNGDERGLLGLAFHPNYLINRRFFVYYNAPPRPGGPQEGSTWNNLSKIVEFRTSSSNPNLADINTERVILELDDPQGNHNGGTLAFGPDDHHLYISIGDGGAANDVAPGHVEDWYDVNAGGNGQDVEANLFGNILRIDVDNGNPYGIPADNPFVGKVGKGEIYAYGFRNPYRMSFDIGGNHELFAGDAGQLLYEEIDIVKKGGNYGWNVKEGTHCFNAANNTTTLPSCPDKDEFGNPLIDPIIELNNARNPAGGKATTIIGGNVYRGLTIPNYFGKYIFGTFSQSFGTPNAELFIATPSTSGGLWSYDEISLKSSPNDIGYYLKGFGQDWFGEIYLTVTGVAGPTGNTGKVFKLVPAK